MVMHLVARSLARCLLNLGNSSLLCPNLLFMTKRTFDSMTTETDTLNPLRVQRTSASAKLPARATPGSAGYDLCASEPCVIPAHGRSLVKTGLVIALPEGTYGRIAPRSGLAVKHFIDTGAGVIDGDYRGEVGVLLFNFGEKDFAVAEGDRIAQLILERIAVADVVEVESMDETKRGAGGFGSTGTQ
ncbi:mitochondrial deoxyuridine 5'-triphosphate nucleotidohydrolase [Cladochytrium replicatum]|nr:mitochondrial deoxyuridine 5'-triphosphate nucleotidohydrolase [Cladochytrium replicatum]